MEPYDAVAFSGGGATAAVFLGALRYLEHTGGLAAARTFAGTSAGAIMALLCALGWRADRMLCWVLENVLSVTDLDVEGILELPARLGIDGGERLEAALRSALPSDWGGKATFLELAKRTGCHLVVCVVNVTCARTEFLSVETAPDLDVVTAVRASTAIPLLYAPVAYRGCLYVDGGLFENLPTSWAGACGLAVRRILAVNVALPFFQPGRLEGPAPEEETQPGIVEYLSMLVRAMVVAANGGGREPAGGAGGSSGVVRVDIEPYEGRCFFSHEKMRFDVDEDGVREMARHGYRQMRAFAEAAAAAEAAKSAAGSSSSAAVA